MGGYLRGFLYRLIMKVAHKYNWHYAPPIYPNGDTHLWCKWCGFRQTIKVVEKKENPQEYQLNALFRTEGGNVD